ncbi:MarR family transcriptional regulator [Priestia aryabhattai]|jgi:DNA-binding MarR family transcriptional regulator|uniref:MarR family winged helix-turn-helix transcriptional regulator n=1 Tax=Priestia TaxID=2800373 RepID=UPI001EBA0C39|nr:MULTISPECIES: MarR family transcriptional regulator [Priestia]MBY0089698.1 MarR family transcriptional regulator [Priestia aryabhattai]MBY0100713.1 MarR family transcriptional regulator [Priestia aryabhattai]MCM3303855.1 MarR family transcriptional regulator [Priestia megaterium]
MNERDNEYLHEQDLIDQFFRFQRQLARYQRYYFINRRDAGALGDQHRGQGRILKLLKLQPKTTQKELSYLLDMRPQSIGELLSKLERKGYIVRTPSEKDRRVLSVELTEAGLEAIEATEEQNNNSGIFDVLSEEEQDTLSHLMQKLNTYLDEEMLKQGHDEGKEFRRPNDLRGFGPHHRFFGGDPEHGPRGFGRGPWGDGAESRTPIFRNRNPRETNRDNNEK